MAKKKLSRAAKVRNMLDKGMKPREIADQLSIPVQTVYNIRYQYNKKKGIGALPKPPLATDGIASVRRKAGRPPKKAIVVSPQTEKPGAFTQVPTKDSHDTTWIVLVMAGVVTTIALMLVLK